MMENNWVFIKKYIPKHAEHKKKFLVIFVLQETKNSNLLDKNRTQEMSSAIFNMKKVDLDKS